MTLLWGNFTGAKDSFDREMAVHGHLEEAAIVAARTDGFEAMADSFNKGLSKSILGRSSFGTTRFDYMDHVDAVVYLGLEEIQGSEFELAIVSDKAKAHEFEKDDNGDPVRNEDGSIRWSYPDAHRLRTNIIWPVLNQWSKLPKDPEAWKTLCNTTPPEVVPTPTKQTHERYMPWIHQITAVANIVARGFCQNDWSGENFATLLCDEPGLGKTWVPFLFATLMRYYRERMARDPNFNPPVMNPWKEDFVLPQKNISMPHGPPPPPSFIADRRLRLSSSDKGGIHILLSDNKFSSVHLLEAKKLVVEGATVVCDYSRVPSSSMSLRAEFWTMINEHLALERDIFIICSHAMLHHDAQLAPKPRSAFSSTDAPCTLFTPSRPYHTLFADNLADLRDPETGTSFALRRLVEMSGCVIGATATPIYTSAADLISLSRLLGVENIVPRPTKNWLLSITTTRRAGDLPNTPFIVGGKFDGTGLTPSSAELLKVTEVVEAEARRAFWAEANKDKQRGKANIKDDQIRKMEQTLLWERSDLNNGIAVDGSWAEVRGHLIKRVIDPIQDLLSPIFIRRDSLSKGPDGLPLTSIKHIDPVPVYVDLSREERKAYEVFDKSLDPCDKLNWATLTRFIRKPHGTRFGWHSPYAPIPKIIEKMCSMIRKMMKDDYHKSNHLKRKIIVQTLWTDLIPFLQLNMCKYGIETRTLTGEIAQTAQRAKIIREFQRDDNCEGEPNAMKLPCSTLIVSDFDSPGIVLDRASEVFLLDPLWSCADARRIISRVGGNEAENDLAVLAK
ncbi:hypothetical protein TREMEDRAFT_64205 [Tremella mesenterica DSM 1558]|uniref:uncharacterized protein n=1 Tax=Tremella mesenterica (strain ATCC 24925 / CBS 8224 / DSM 1558 / NBRC 9311 / NRRL Y-6157 / RJB 2259-6 / UBC 559-6) TaxID=578456 RepID=UPI0003F4A571|nr:uncharacterized protein TREMEDRAFT_64205 [Tremella mesenterica DSM 1558]EIW67614.1 hypothetical protein TREMEDRAFT_64205 [Tremella mesenterica DSM 1558]